MVMLLEGGHLQLCSPSVQRWGHIALPLSAQYVLVCARIPFIFSPALSIVQAVKHETLTQCWANFHVNQYIYLVFLQLMSKSSRSTAHVTNYVSAVFFSVILMTLRYSVDNNYLFVFARHSIVSCKA